MAVVRIVKEFDSVYALLAKSANFQFEESRVAISKNRSLSAKIEEAISGQK